jgi:glucose/mannose-6-phosphate isomerase
MKNLVTNFNEQLLDALNNLKGIKFSNTNVKFSNIVISGLGGSGIGGSMVQDYFNAEEIAIPVFVTKDYTIPAFVGKDTLFIACSYSGNTEETLESVARAEKKKAIITCITSGGALADYAAKKKLNIIQLPTGWPPRAAFAYSSTALLETLKQYKALKKDYAKDILAAVGIITSEAKAMQKQAKVVAKKMMSKTIMMYCVQGFESILVRFRQQINENGKMLACHHVIPEMNHNELVGWRQKGDYCTIFFRNAQDHKRSQARIEINKEVIKKYSKSIIEIWSQGDSFLERAYYMVHFGDWVSVYLSELYNLDPTEVKVIDHLKGSLAGLK